ncbi:PAS domain S-box protein [Thermodesulfobacteriota bacterium]
MKNSKTGYKELEGDGGVSRPREADSLAMNEDQEVSDIAYFLNNLEIVSQALIQGKDVEDIIDDVLETVFSIFACDRIWLFYPCDPDAPTFRVLAEKNKPEYPGAFTSGQELPITPEAADTIKQALVSGSPAVFDPESGNQINDVAKQFSVQSEIMMAIHPHKGKPWMFGMHQCSYARIWTKNEQVLFKEISFRVVEGLNNLILMKDLHQSEQKYRRFFSTVHNGWAYHKVVVDDNNNPVDYLFLEINPAFEKQTGLKREDVIGKRVTEVLPGIEKDPADWIGRFGETALTGKSVTFESYADPINKWYTATASSPEPGYFIVVFEDISQRKKIEQEKEELIADLQVALEEIKTLQGILPLCSFCKKIRDDQGSWNRLESYLRDHSDAEISHGVCPECMAEHYPEIHQQISPEKKE